jgi:hypothetical protein
MDFNYALEQMHNDAETVRSLTVGISAEQACWKPDPESWSILEVINHLYDEEREDFRLRVDYTLHRPGEAWPPIDPKGWVTQREYNRRELGQSVNNFLAERQKSLAWLRSLEQPDWDVSRTAPFGVIKAGDVFAAWVAHDLLHIRQLVELHWAYTVQQMKPFDVRYAGEW